MASASTEPSQLRLLLCDSSVRSSVRQWLVEDIPHFDYSGFCVGAALASATLWAKEDGRIAGRPFVDAVFTEVGCAVQWEDNAPEGCDVLLGDGEDRRKIATVTVYLLAL